MLYPAFAVLLSRFLSVRFSRYPISFLAVTISASIALLVFLFRSKTLIVQVYVIPWFVAVIVVFPVFFPVICPEEETVAIDLSDDFHEVVPYALFSFKDTFFPA